MSEKLKTVDIKGKPYVEVNERIKFFRNTYPSGAIINEIVSIENGVCVMKSTILVDDRIVAIGHAYEKEGSTFINKTSYIENCETSAVGRALGMFGIGIDTSVASAEEVQNAIVNQEKKKLSEAQVKRFYAIAKQHGINAKQASDTVITRYKKKVDNLTKAEYDEVIMKIESK